MSRNVITPRHLDGGARWDFITAAGKRVEYVLDRQIVPATANQDPKLPGLDAMYVLTNVSNQRQAMVTERWLREGQVADRGGYWLAIAEAGPVEVAA